MSARMSLGEKLLFGSSGTAVRFLGRGWDELGSDDGRWSVDHVADFLFELSPPPQSDMTLDIEMVPFVRAPQLVRQSVEIYINGLWAGFFSARSPVTASTTIRTEMLRMRGTNVLSFVFPDACSSIELGIGKGARSFGFNFQSLRLNSRVPASKFSSGAVKFASR